MKLEIAYRPRPGVRAFATAPPGRVGGIAEARRRTVSLRTRADIGQRASPADFCASTRNSRRKSFDASSTRIPSSPQRLVSTSTSSSEERAAPLAPSRFRSPRRLASFAYYRFVTTRSTTIRARSSESGWGTRTKGAASSAAADGEKAGPRPSASKERAADEVFRRTGAHPSCRVSFPASGPPADGLGNTVRYRAVDSINALDLDMALLPRKPGILGKVGFSELRNPACGRAKMLG